MSDDYWKEYESDRWNPENVGDTITGIVVKRDHATVGNSRCPLLTLRVNDEGGTREVCASQTMLKQALADLHVGVGDKLRITLTELRQTGQPSPMKVFDVRHRVGEAVAEQPPAPPAPEPEAVEQAVAERTADPEFDIGEEPF